MNRIESIRLRTINATTNTQHGSFGGEGTNRKAEDSHSSGCGDYWRSRSVVIDT